MGGSYCLGGRAIISICIERGNTVGIKAVKFQLFLKKCHIFSFQDQRIIAVQVIAWYIGYL